MSSAGENKKDINEQIKNQCNCKVLKNTFFITLATVAASTLVYFTIKEGHRVKLENELLAYEVW